MNTFAIRVAKLLASNPTFSTDPEFFMDLAKELEHYGFKLQVVLGKVQLIQVRK